LGKKEEITEGRKAGRASKTPLSSRSESATAIYFSSVEMRQDLIHDVI